MEEFRDYDIKYPDLVLSIIRYFSIGNGNISKKSVSDFCLNSYKTPQGEEIVQPEIVAKICDILCRHGKMSCIKNGTAMGLYNNYGIIFNEPASSKLKSVKVYYNSIVYGFEYIYNQYKNSVLPLVAYSGDKQAMGTCFRILNGIATAKHCLTDGDKVAIKGYRSDMLNQSKVLVSKNKDIDIAFIVTDEGSDPSIDKPSVLQDVLVMGYPKVPWFNNFCAGELATISASAKLRMTATRGAIAAIEPMYYPRNCPDILLITARIRGGNSGGPLINSAGSVVGIAVGTPSGEGDSDDDIGYGMAYPIQVLFDILKEESELQIDFCDFSED